MSISGCEITFCKMCVTKSSVLVLLGNKWLGPKIALAASWPVKRPCKNGETRDEMTEHGQWYMS